MLYIATSLQQLRFGQLMEVYLESNLEKAERIGLLQAEQDFYQYLDECFFPTPGAVYAVWVEGNEYISALRLEPYRDGLCTVESGFILEDMLTAFERTADHCSNVAVEMLQVAEGKLEAHEYLNALKAGELRESAKYSERFAKYKAQYAVPEDDDLE